MKNILNILKLPLWSHPTQPCRMSQAMQADKLTAVLRNKSCCFHSCRKKFLGPISSQNKCLPLQSCWDLPSGLFDCMQAEMGPLKAKLAFFFPVSTLFIPKMALHAALFFLSPQPWYSILRRHVYGSVNLSSSDYHQILKPNITIICKTQQSSWPPLNTTY